MPRHVKVACKQTQRKCTGKAASGAKQLLPNRIPQCRLCDNKRSMNIIVMNTTKYFGRNTNTSLLAQASVARERTMMSRGSPSPKKFSWQRVGIKPNDR